MRIGILGAGDVGRALGTGFAKVGHQVKMGAREATNERAKAWAAGTGSAASTGTFAEAAQFADLAVLCTLWSGTENALRLAGAQNLAGKVLIDATNPLASAQGAPPSLVLGHTDSGGEQVQRWAPQARVIKAFNTVKCSYVQAAVPGRTAGHVYLRRRCRREDYRDWHADGVWMEHR
jgi:predicted dinucleotide-binding enzyme